MERKARAEHSRMQRAKAPEHPICAPCGKACADDEFPSARSSCASVPDAGGPAAIAAAAPALTHESPVAIESALEPLVSPLAPLPLWEKGLRKAQASSPAAAGYRGSGKTSCVAQMSDLYQRDEAACGAPKMPPRRQQRRRPAQAFPTRAGRRRSPRLHSSTLATWYGRQPCTSA